jgi:hypothetical protein
MPRPLRLVPWLLLLSVPAPAATLVEVEGLLSFELASASSCPGPGERIGVDVSLAPGGPLADAILFDLHAAWDPGYWLLRGIHGAGVVERDDAQGFLNDLFGDVGAGDPIPAGVTLFQLVFEVVGSPDPARSVLEIGDLSARDLFFDRAVLVADSDFQVVGPTPNSQLLTPEPGSGLLLGLGLFGLAWRRRRRALLACAALAGIACDDGGRVVDQRTFLWHSGSAELSPFSASDANPFRGRVAPSKPLRLLALDSFGPADPEAIRYHEGDALPHSLFNPISMVTTVQPAALTAVLPVAAPGTLETRRVDPLDPELTRVLEAPANIFLDLRNLPRVGGSPLALQLPHTFPGRVIPNPLSGSGLVFSPDLTDDLGGDFAGDVLCTDPYTALGMMVLAGLTPPDATAQCIESSSIAGGAGTPGGPGPDANGAYTPPGLTKMRGGMGELPMRPAPDLSLLGLRQIARDETGFLFDQGAVDPPAGSAQGLYVPSRGMRLGQPMHYERNVDPASGRPLIGRLDLEPVGACAAAGESAADPLNAGGLAYNSAFASHPFSVTPGAPVLVPPSTVALARGGVGSDPGCLRPGGSTGGANAFGFDAGSLAETNALANHHANQGLFASLCRSTSPFEVTLDPSACLFQLFNTQAVLNRQLLPISFTEQLAALLAGEPTGNAGPQRVLGLIASNQKGAIAGALLAPVPLAPLNRLFNDPVNPFDRNLNGNADTADCDDPSDPSSCDLGGFDGFDGRVQLPGRMDVANFDETLVAPFLTPDKALTNEQRALGGCGPFYASRCDSSLAFRDVAKGIFWGGFGGLDLQNGEASALFEALRAQDASGSTTSAEPQPGAAGYAGPPVCMRRIGGQLVRLPGCRGVKSLEVTQDGLGAPLLEVEFDPGYLPSVDGCVIGNQVRRADASIVPVVLVGASAGSPQLAAELALCNGAAARRVVPQRVFVDSEPDGLPDTDMAGNPITQVNPACSDPGNAVGTGSGVTALRVCSAAAVSLVDQPLIHPTAGCVDSPAHFPVHGADDCRYWMNRDLVEELLAGTAQLFRSELAALSWNLTAFLAVTSCDVLTPDAGGSNHAPPSGPSIADDPQCFDPAQAWDPARCSLAAPQRCKNAKALLGLAPPLPAGGVTPDDDGDGVAADGDGSGVAGDRPCRTGEVLGCDDNCGDLPNPAQVNSNGFGGPGSDGFGNACDPDLDGDGDVDESDRALLQECFQTGTSSSIDCAEADLVGGSLETEPDPEAPRVDGYDRLQLLRWLRNPASAPGSSPER